MKARLLRLIGANLVMLLGNSIACIILGIPSRTLAAVYLVVGLLTNYLVWCYAPCAEDDERPAGRDPHPDVTFADKDSIVTVVRADEFSVTYRRPDGHEFTRSRRGFIKQYRAVSVHRKLDQGDLTGC